MRMPDQGEWVFDKEDGVEPPKTFWWWHQSNPHKEKDKWEVVDNKGKVVVSGTKEECIDQLMKLEDATPS